MTLTAFRRSQSCGTTAWSCCMVACCSSATELRWSAMTNSPIVSGFSCRSSTYTKFKHHHNTSFTGKERAKFTSRWENAFQGRVHYEPGMRERYASAVEEEQKMEAELRGDGSTNGKNATGESSGSSRPPPRHQWGEESLSDRDVNALSKQELQDYIVDRLTRSERRIRFAPDYGGAELTKYLHSGEELLAEAESLLTRFCLMNGPLQMKIDELRDVAYHIKMTNDLL